MTISVPSDSESQQRSIDVLVAVGGKRDGSSVKDTRQQTGFSQRDTYRIEDGRFHDKNVIRIGLYHILDQSRRLA